MGSLQGFSYESSIFLAHATVPILCWNNGIYVYTSYMLLFTLLTFEQKGSDSFCTGLTNPGWVLLSVYLPPY